MRIELAIKPRGQPGGAGVIDRSCACGGPLRGM